MAFSLFSVKFYKMGITKNISKKYLQKQTNTNFIQRI